MNPKRINRLLIIFGIVLLIATVSVLVMNLSFFDITEIEATYTGKCASLLPGTERLISSFYGENLNRVGTKYVERLLESQNEVLSAKVSKYYPQKLIIAVEYKPFEVKIKAQEGPEISYYLASSEEMIEVSHQTFTYFQSIPTVNLDFQYSQALVGQGYDLGFTQVLGMLSGLDSQSLISVIKYDNNTYRSFGQLILSFGSGDVNLVVRDPVTSKRLEQAIEIIIREMPESGKKVEYDLYAAELVRRN